MQTLHVNGTDMAYLDVGRGTPLICVHGSLCDFRIWSPVQGPLSKHHRVITVSLRHCFPEHWDGKSSGKAGDDYSIDQHIADVIAFIESLGAGPVNLMGHSRGGHVSFRVAQKRPDLLRKLILAEPGGEPDLTLSPEAPDGPSPLAKRFGIFAAKIAEGDVDGGLQMFMDGLEGPGAWQRLPAVAKQLLRDNATTLIGQAKEIRRPYSLADAQSVTLPTLLIGGGRTKGMLRIVLDALGANMPNARVAMIERASHPMFEQAPVEYARLVLDFLAD